FVRGEATEERQIGSLIERRAKVVQWQSVRDRGGPIRFRQWQALMVRYRHEGGAGKLPHYVGKAWHAEPTEHRKGQPVDMRVNQVKIFRAPGDRLQQHGAGGIWIGAFLSETQR